MKKLLVTLFMLTGLWPAISSAAPLNIFACEAEWAALSQSMGGENVSVYTATSALQDVHSVDARPSLIAKLRRADLLVCTGASLESGWLPQVQRQAGNNKVQSGAGVFFAADQVSLLEKPAVLDRANGDVHPEGNPHVQFDPQRLLQIASALQERLSKLDPANASTYQDNYAAFAQHWQQAIQQWRQQAAGLKGRKVVVQHSTFTYLLNWLGMESIAMLEPKPGLPPTTAHLQQVLQAIHGQPVLAILSATYQDARPSEWLNERAAVPVLRLPQSVGGDDASTDLMHWYSSVIQQLVQVAK